MDLYALGREGVLGKSKFQEVHKFEEHDCILWAGL